MYSRRVDKIIVKKILNKYNNECYSDTSGKLFNYSHKMMEKYLNKSSYEEILEIGAGTTPHINFISHKYKKYYCLENSKFVIKYLNRNFKKIKTFYSNNTKIPNKKFDRIILSHSLEHIYKPEKLLTNLFRRLKKEGVMSIAIPIDPGLFYRLARFYKKKNSKLGLSALEYDYVNAIEHINSYQNNVAIIKYLFKNFKKYYFPFNLMPYDLNLFCFFQIYKN